MQGVKGREEAQGNGGKKKKDGTTRGDKQKVAKGLGKLQMSRIGERRQCMLKK